MWLCNRRSHNDRLYWQCVWRLGLWFLQVVANLNDVIYHQHLQVAVPVNCWPGRCRVKQLTIFAATMCWLDNESNQTSYRCSDVSLKASFFQNLLRIDVWPDTRSPPSETFHFLLKNVSAQDRRVSNCASIC